MADGLNQALLLVFAWYAVIGLFFAFWAAQQALQMRDLITKDLSPLECVFGVILVFIVWPVLLAEMVDQHKNGPWRRG